MDRVSAANFLTVSGRRMWQDKNPGAGIPAGTEFIAAFMNSLQETILATIEGTNQTPTDANVAQLLQAIISLSGAGLTSVSANVALTASNAGVVLVNAATGSLTVTLPAANSLTGSVQGTTQLNRLPLGIIRTDTSANIVTLLCPAGTTFFGGLTTMTLANGQSLSLVSDGNSVYYPMPIPSGGVATKAAAYTVLASDNRSLIVAAAVPITLPATAGISAGFGITILSSVTGTTVLPNGGTVNLPAGATTGAITLPAASDFLTLEWDGSVWRTTGGSAAMVGAAARAISWSAPGTYSWVVPSNVTQIWLSGCGAGGGGGNANTGSFNSGGGGGGAGAAVLRQQISVTPGASISITIGAAGAGSIYGGAAATGGGTSSFGSLLSLPGGGGAQNGTGYALTAGGTSGGAGGSVGQQGGANSTYSTNYWSIGGAGGSGLFGAGGAGSFGSQTGNPPMAGSGFGAGGGGSSASGNGMPGSGGFLKVEY